MVLVMILAVFRVMILAVFQAIFPQTQIRHIVRQIIQLIWRSISHKKNKEYIDDH